MSKYFDQIKEMFGCRLKKKIHKTKCNDHGYRIVAEYVLNKIRIEKPSLYPFRTKVTYVLDETTKNVEKTIVLDRDHYYEQT